MTEKASPLCKLRSEAEEELDEWMRHKETKRARNAYPAGELCSPIQLRLDAVSPPYSTDLSQPSVSSRFSKEDRLLRDLVLLPFH